MKILCKKNHLPYFIINNFYNCEKLKYVTKVFLNSDNEIYYWYYHNDIYNYFYSDKELRKLKLLKLKILNEKTL